MPNFKISFIRTIPNTFVLWVYIQLFMAFVGRDLPFPIGPNSNPYDGEGDKDEDEKMYIPICFRPAPRPIYLFVYIYI